MLNWISLKPCVQTLRRPQGDTLIVRRRNRINRVFKHFQLPGRLPPKGKNFTLLSLILILTMSCSSDPTPALPSMVLEPGSNREVAYTDKQDAFWMTRSGGYNNSPWHGLTAAKRSYLEDLFIYVDEKLLPREEAVVRVDPVQLVREYADLGIRETWTLLDGQHSLLLQLESEQPTSWSVQPAIRGGNQAEDFDIKTSDQELNIYNKRLKGVPSSFPYSRIWFSQPMQWQPARTPELQLFNSFLTQQASYSSSYDLTILVSLSEDIIVSDIQTAWLETAQNSRQDRMTGLAEQTKMSSNRKDIDTAIAWAHASLDALVMDQMGMGIYAGLPWFDDYWGRDTFISFAGAVLISGKFEDARQILLAFAKLQNMNQDDPHYGRIPNRAQPEDIIYNTADGTPWFVRSVWDTYRYTGDEVFLQEMWPYIQHAMEGALQYWTDESGLLTHADADTWMDARGPDGPWSPRGDRAIDIQFIWRDQLEITKRLAQKFHNPDLFKVVDETLSRLKAGLRKYKSINEDYLVDHLNTDGTQDQQIRPNIFLVPPIFQETCDWASFKYLGPQLITDKGVLSLSQDDLNFHPFHQHPGLYVKDAAYHNGIIWSWNSAATITQAIRYHQYHYAQALFDDLTTQILHRGAIGTIAELSDSWPKAGQIHLSGTLSQAWSLAEYLRSFYQDILGVQPDLTRSRVRMAPRLLGGMEQVRFNVPVGSDLWKVKYDEAEDFFEIAVTRNQREDMNLELEVRHEAGLALLELEWTSKSIQLRFEKQMGQWTIPAEFLNYQTSSSAIEIPISSLPFCVVDTTRDIPILQGPEHRLLKTAELKDFEKAFQSITKLSDPHGDDHGESNHYSYPENLKFETGIVDILGIQIGSSTSNYLFELDFVNLVDPGWHPEYGYQLTYTAIGISYSSETGTTFVGKNSRASFKGNFKADQILYISGSLLLVNDRQQIQAEYLPQSVSGAIGNAKTEKIRFTLPREIFLKNLEDASFQLAVGFQDDHGGAGLGDFRNVIGTSEAWVGGGNADSKGSNVFDWVIPQQ